LRAGVDFPNLAELRIIATRKNEWGRWYPLLVTAAFTGMRASELRGLAWSEVDLDGATIFVRQRADQWGVIGKPKSKAANRDIPLTPLVVNTLGQWKEECPSGEFNLTFPNGAGNVESHQNILHRFWEPFQIANGMGANSDQTDGQGQPIQRAKYGLHALRHVAASLYIAHLGWTPKKLQVVMGHSSIQMTFDLYGHLFEDQTADREAMRKLEAVVVVAA
jgi:integrase